VVNIFVPFLDVEAFLIKKHNLRRLCSVSSSPGTISVSDVFVKLEALCIQLEHKYPKLYTGVCKQWGTAVITEKTIGKNLSSMAQVIFKRDITWFKIASFYNLASGVAVDCVKLGHPEYIFGIVEAVALVIERDLANWMINQGGWVSLLSKHRIPEDHSVLQKISLSVTGLVVVLISVAVIMKTLGNIVLNI